MHVIALVLFALSALRWYLRSFSFQRDNIYVVPFWVQRVPKRCNTSEARLSNFHYDFPLPSQKKSLTVTRLRAAVTWQRRVCVIFLRVSQCENLGFVRQNTKGLPGYLASPRSVGSAWRPRNITYITLRTARLTVVTMRYILGNTFAITASATILILGMLHVYYNNITR